jgi:hypothetical protein
MIANAVAQAAFESGNSKWIKPLEMEKQWKDKKNTMVSRAIALDLTLQDGKFVPTQPMPLSFATDLAEINEQWLFALEMVQSFNLERKQVAQIDISNWVLEDGFTVDDTWEMAGFAIEKFEDLCRKPKPAEWVIDMPTDEWIIDIPEDNGADFIAGAVAEHAFYTENDAWLKALEGKLVFSVEKNKYAPRSNQWNFAKIMENKWDNLFHLLAQDEIKIRARAEGYSMDTWEAAKIAVGKYEDMWYQEIA